MSSQGVSVGSLVSRFKFRIIATLVLVALEGGAVLLFPLFIGLAINGLLGGSVAGVFELALVAIAAVAIGSIRRFVDTRAYAGAYEATASELVARERDRGTPVSTISARVGLVGEFVEFLEESLPGIAMGAVSLVGTLVILASISPRVSWACVALACVMVLQYGATASLNYRLNAGYNDELEKQVAIISNPGTRRPSAHFNRLMRWRIRLSDLETLNYAVLFLCVVLLLVFAPVELVDGPTAEYGLVLAALMYVLQYVEDLAAFPLYVQSLIRLHEISARLR